MVSFLAIESSICVKKKHFLNSIKNHSMEHLKDCWEVYVDKFKKQMFDHETSNTKISIAQMFATDVNKDDITSS